MTNDKKVFTERCCPVCGAMYQDVLDDINRQLAEAAEEDRIEREADYNNQLERRNI